MFLTIFKFINNNIKNINNLINNYIIDTLMNVRLNIFSIFI
jgi:hypothetical protein